MLLSELDFHIKQLEDTKVNKDEISKQIESIMKMIQKHKLDKEPNEPLFSTRPLKNIDFCASCSQELPTVKGTKADVYQWNKFPKENFRISH